MNNITLHHSIEGNQFVKVEDTVTGDCVFIDKDEHTNMITIHGYATFTLSDFDRLLEKVDVMLSETKGIEEDLLDYYE